MHDMTQAGGGPGPARAVQQNAAELARVDAQLELAAKKAALAGLERAAVQGGTAASADAPPPMSKIVIERDGKIITLENPTADQVAALGVSRGADVQMSGWMMVAMTGTVMWAIVAIVWMYLAHRRRMRSIGTEKTSSDTAARLARIETAVDSIAVEVERISEGQRYTSRMLSEGAAVPVGALVPEMEAVFRNRGDA
jgi:hypothetical protein